MSTVVNFHGKNYIEPGSYAITVYNPTASNPVANFGNVMIIDSGIGASGSYEFAGGSGVHGQLSNGMKSVYEFSNYQDFWRFTGGGLIGDVARKIFSPVDGVAGAPKLFYARAATTTSAKIVMTLAEGINFTLNCKNEGVVGNAVLDGGVLKLGYAAKLVTGSTVGKFVLQVYKGNFNGVDAYGEPYGSKTFEAAGPDLIAESPELGTLKELYDWALLNKQIINHFTVGMTGLGTTVLKELALVSASGGTTDYLNDTEYDDLLENIAELDITFFLATSTVDKGIEPATNGKLFTFINTIAKFDEFIVIPGGSDETDLFGEGNTSEAIAKYYDSSKVVVVHGSPEETRKDGNGIKQLSPIYLAATVIGISAGSAPQTPLTHKRVGYQSFAYSLKTKEREKALQAGIMHVKNLNGRWVINQGITTLQDNKKTIADDGRSFELSIELIKAQLNKELIIDADARFTGETAAQANPETFKNFTETKLARFVATKDSDNLLISWKNVRVSATNGDFVTTYDFVPNVPVNKTFFIGNILDYKF